MTTLGCSFEGPMFGAVYPDATCIDGYLWDLDSCDDDGNLYGGGDVPCPHCNTREYVVDYLDKHFSGNARQRRRATRAVIARMRRKAGDWA
ncbi:hypothetical protein C7399_11285 [Paraburkholderia tropica]|uniref:Uncharacterized protein n=1 Tax=Paraburkholderia tropica TaxID=92647 RepID=A0ABX5MLE0_9BURK|nr:hypothetical protein [Paraburkholderia tropica]PXX14475.1 hypothetical protein C7400_11285 [Paraburkholderia tropica]PZW79541.1 hypothetical protein C7399_11285 [Paraburkholderia tropica]